MTNKECEMQLKQLIIDWDEDTAIRINATDIEAIRHLLLENQTQYDETIKLQQENKELKLELSGYREAILRDKEMLGLKEQNKKYKEVIDKAIKHVSSLSSKGRDCMIYANVKKDILAILKEVE